MRKFILNFRFEQNKLINENRQEKIRLISSFYYDMEWWSKPIAIEWWERDGHFNELLYSKVLMAKLNNIES